MGTNRLGKKGQEGSRTLVVVRSSVFGEGASKGLESEGVLGGKDCGIDGGSGDKGKGQGSSGKAKKYKKSDKEWWG